MLEIFSASLPWIFYGLLLVGVGGVVREIVKGIRGRRSATQQPRTVADHRAHQESVEANRVRAQDALRKAINADEIRQRTERARRYGT